MKVISRYVLRPDRKVFYFKASQEDISNFYKGIIPDAVLKYDGSFGTYGCPGLFIIKQDGVSEEVIGIEYRPDDDRIEYPCDLEEVLLPRRFFRIDIVVEDGKGALSKEAIIDHVTSACAKDPEYQEFLGGSACIDQDPEIIQVYIKQGHCRVMISADFVKHVEPDVTDNPAAMMYAKMYYHDFITDYHNWNYIGLRMVRYTYYGIQDYAFVYFDIKDFNSVNVVYGHRVANNLLYNIAKKMDGLDWVYCGARTDNDNYAMMIKDMPREETQRLLEEFFESVSYLEDDPNYKVYFRCGVVPMKNTIEMGGTVADAGKQSKAFGTARFKTDIIFFTDEMQEEQDRSIRLRAYLDTAIENDEFLVYLQPKYDINTEKVKGAEALIRWKYMGKDMLDPGMFVPLFESGGLISKLDDIVLKKVCHKLKQWENEGKQLLPISVNVSRKSIGIPGLAEHLTEIVDSYGVEHSLIDFELTESAAYDNQEIMINVLNGLKEKGFKISIDDFGTGYSSLSLLPIMPCDTLKIDKSFVDGIGHSDKLSKSCSVVKQVIALGKELNMTCLAEGAEEKEQVDLLREFGCEVVQGYYYNRPIPVEEYEKLL